MNIFLKFFRVFNKKLYGYRFLHIRKRKPKLFELPLLAHEHLKSRSDVLSVNNKTQKEFLPDRVAITYFESELGNASSKKLSQALTGFKLLRPKLKGNTLLEGIVAMTVLMVSFSICAAVFANLLKTGNNHSETSALLEMKRILNDCTEKDRLIDETYDYTSFRILKKVLKAENSENLLSIKLKAVNADGKEIGILKKIVSTDDIENFK